MDRFTAEVSAALLGVLEKRRGAGDGRVLSRLALAQLCGCTERELRLAVRELRRGGQPVVAERGGFRLAVDLDEVLAYTATLRRQAEATMELVARVEGAARGLWPS